MGAVLASSGKVFIRNRWRSGELSSVSISNLMIQDLGFQFRISVIGETLASSESVFIKNR